MVSKLSAVALIPARSGSVRVPNKNIMPLEGHPMIAYTIRSAVNSGVFDKVVCATDSKEYAEIAKYYGAEVPSLRPLEISGSLSPDLEWVKWILNALSEAGSSFDVFSILRPTSPFRRPETIRRAWEKFQQHLSADSLRAVERCKEHPGKMWVLRKDHMLPLFPFESEGTPWHSSQYAALPEVYVQNASLEMAHVSVPFEKQSIAGEVIVPFVTDGYEGFDINNSEDCLMAESLLARGKVDLPLVELQRYHVPVVSE